MKWLNIILLLILPSIGSTAFAENSRMARVAETDWMDIWERNFDECETQVFQSEITSICKKQGRQTNLRIDVSTPYKSETFGSHNQKYLADRKLYCARIVAERVGRCIGTFDISPRHSLRGFRSVSLEDSGLYRMEFVVFHREELIRASVLSDIEDLDIEYDGWLQWTLARLTPLW
ncbi:hypothetical protein [uncultured Ruegeria sp.]|uniref:hypothetical protein n=1 Tax=uncultured Ruegeria sp. TaxID=259304 RepID=UPI00260688BC|nr:hypothetical protein [uncultured Ruegeria sp.]